MTPLKYLREQLNFTTTEWAKLTPQDKEGLRQWAAEEMDHLGIERKGN